MRVLLLLFVAWIAVSTAAILTAPGKLRGKGKDIFLGFLEGIGAETGNLTKCITDEERGMTDMHTFVTMLEHGIKSLNKTEIEQSWGYLALSLNELVLMLNDCGAEKIAGDLAKMIALLRTPGGWLTVLKDEGIKILAYAKDITFDLINAIQDYKAAKYFDFGFQLGKVLGILL